MPRSLRREAAHSDVAGGAVSTQVERLMRECVRRVVIAALSVASATIRWASTPSCSVSPFSLKLRHRGQVWVTRWTTRDAGLRTRLPARQRALRGEHEVARRPRACFCRRPTGVDAGQRPAALACRVTADVLRVARCVRALRDGTWLSGCASPHRPPRLLRRPTACGKGDRRRIAQADAGSAAQLCARVRCHAAAEGGAACPSRAAACAATPQPACPLQLLLCSGGWGGAGVRVLRQWHPAAGSCPLPPHQAHHAFALYVRCAENAGVPSRARRCPLCSPRGQRHGRGRRCGSRAQPRCTGHHRAQAFCAPAALLREPRNGSRKAANPCMRHALLRTGVSGGVTRKSAWAWAPEEGREAPQHSDEELNALIADAG
jgi:hypothetical protein